MKKIQNVLASIALVSMLFSCSEGDSALEKKIVFDGDKEALKHGYIQGLGISYDDNGDPVTYFAIALTSGDLVYSEVENDLVGTGSVIYWYLASPSSLGLEDGEYTINLDDVYLKNEAEGVALKSYNSTTNDGVYYAINSGTIKISISGSTYKITFNLIGDDYDTEAIEEVVIKGSYEGKLSEEQLFNNA